jgi:hypothetical protein
MDLEISKRNGENEMQEEIFFCFWVMDGLEWNERFLGVNDPSPLK